RRSPPGSAGVRSSPRPYLRSAAGAETPPKRTVRRSRVAEFCVRRTCGAEPPPQRPLRESAIFLEGLRTTGCFLLDMRAFSLSGLAIGFKLRRPHRISGGTCKVPVRRGLHHPTLRGKQ